MRLLGYVTEREEMVAYLAFVAKGRQIGSGPTEAMCQAAALRVQEMGKKWDTDNAEAVRTLEALDHIELWEKDWDLPPLLAL